MIELRHLLLMQAIKKSGTLSGAAVILNLSPSALSHQLRQLEELLETSMFERNKNKLTLTRAGKEIEETAEAIIEQIQQMEEKIQEINRDDIKDYIHGYSPEESQRLYDQSTSIADVIHWDSKWEEGSLILEVGCGVGAQTRIIARQNPLSKFVAVDLSTTSIAEAEEISDKLQLNNVEFKEADARALPYPNGHFDHIFVCFLLEHIPSPSSVIHELLRVLKENGSITVVEGDHGSTYFHPASEQAERAIQAQVNLQKMRGGNANIGRELFPLLSSCGVQHCKVSPRQIYVDSSKPTLVEGFIKNTFTAMIEGVKQEAIANNIISKEEMRAGIQALHRTAEEDGTFCYTFFKAKGFKSASLTANGVN